jgi:branched-chain amino acid transport system ATP-binding protein
MLSLSSVRVLLTGKPVLDGVSFGIAKGEVVGLIGAPGCGKSTLLHTVFGLMRLADGRILYHGRDISRREPITSIRDGVVLVPQGGQVFRRLPVEENLYLASYTVARNRVADRISAVYELFPRLGERRSQAAGSLSGGERQMLALGMGLIPEPNLLLLDEPSTGLSPLWTERMLLQIKSLAKSLGCTVLVVEQNVKNAMLVSDRVLVLRRGRVAYEHDVVSNPEPQALLDAYLFKGQG